VEEMLRYVSPTTFTGARPRVDVEVEGERFEAGTQRLMFYAAANHDPGVFPDPDRFDITRQAKGHLAFSAGAHYCLGAPLARMEAEIGPPLPFAAAGRTDAPDPAADHRRGARAVRAVRPRRGPPSRPSPQRPAEPAPARPQ